MITDPEYIALKRQIDAADKTLRHLSKEIDKLRSERRATYNIDKKHELTHKINQLCHEHDHSEAMMTRERILKEIQRKFGKEIGGPDPRDALNSDYHIYWDTSRNLKSPKS